jgi:hypothetical protein
MFSRLSDPFFFRVIYLANPCSSSPCLNQAICQANWNTTNTWFNCRCVGTFTGTRCETSLLNPCSGLCMNGYIRFCWSARKC